MSEPSWDDFGGQKPAPPREPSELDRLCASVFGTGNGKTLITELRRRYIDNSGNPLADERALRVLATQRHFVRELELACERGLKPKPKAT